MKKNKSLVKPILIFFLLSLFSLPAYAYELVIPSLDYRTGPYAPNGIPVANGFSDYLKMLNARCPRVVRHSTSERQSWVQIPQAVLLFSPNPNVGCPAA